MARTQDEHSWSVDDDIVAFYLYKFGDAGLPYKKKEIAELIYQEKQAWNKFNMRLGNYKYLDTGVGGLNKPSLQERKVYEDYKNTPQDELQVKVIKILKTY